MSALPPKADIDGARWNVRLGPIAEIHRNMNIAANGNGWTKLAPQVRLAPGNGPIARISSQVHPVPKGIRFSPQTRPCAELVALCRLSRGMIEQTLRPSPKGGTCACFSSASAASR
jgi:hypothetical protein